MSHPDEGMIHAWLDGELDAAEAARVESLVKNDAEWAAAAAEARGFIAATSRIVSSLDDVPANVIPAGSKRAPATPVVATKPRRFQRTAWVGLAVAASLLLVVQLVPPDAGIETNATAKADDRPAEAAAAKDELARTQESAEEKKRVIPSAPAPAPASPSGARANERDARNEIALGDAVGKQSAAQDKATPQQLLAQQQTAQQQQPAAPQQAQQLQQVAPQALRGQQATTQRQSAAGAGASAPPAAAPALASTLARGDADAKQKTSVDTSTRSRQLDSLKKEMEKRAVNLSPAVTTGRAEATERRSLGFTVATTPTPPLECYRERVATTGADLVHRVRRTSDSTAVEAPAVSEAITDSRRTAGSDRALLAPLVLQLRGDTLILTRLGAPARTALKVSCPQP